MVQRLLRAVYAIEFLIALAATLEVWREAGGQGHLDLVPWYGKLFLSLGLSASIVKLTAVWTRAQKKAVLKWAMIVALFVIAEGLVTYYYHLNEPLDEDEGNVTLTAFDPAGKR